MKLEQAKTTAKALTELSEYQKELRAVMKSTSKQTAATKRLWREGNKSRLIKLGGALIVFPDPTPCTLIVGASFVAAGLVQKGIQNRSIYVEDVTKTFQSTFKDICAARFNLQI
jgi:hypothetical protein